MLFTWVSNFKDPVISVPNAHLQKKAKPQKIEAVAFLIVVVVCHFDQVKLDL